MTAQPRTDIRPVRVEDALAARLPTAPRDEMTAAILVQVSHGATVTKTFWTPEANPEPIVLDRDPGTISLTTTAEGRLSETIRGARPMTRIADVEGHEEEGGWIILRVTVNTNQERSRQSAQNASPTKAHAVAPA